MRARHGTTHDPCRTVMLREMLRVRSTGGIAGRAHPQVPKCGQMSPRLFRSRVQGARVQGLYRMQRGLPASKWQVYPIEY